MGCTLTNRGNWKNKAIHEIDGYGLFICEMPFKNKTGHFNCTSKFKLGRFADSKNTHRAQLQAGSILATSLGALGRSRLLWRRCFLGKMRLRSVAVIWYKFIKSQTTRIVGVYQLRSFSSCLLC